MLAESNNVTEHPLPSITVAEELSNDDFMSLPAGAVERAKLPPPRPKADGETGTEERTSWNGSKLPMVGKDPLIGTTLHDTYAVCGVLGEGGMGRVYEARHTRIQTKRYAIKVLHSTFALDPDLRLRFQREAEAAATIEHDGIVGTYDLGETPQGWPYMVCEYLSGEDLHSYLKSQGPLPPKVVIHIGRQLCSALRTAHARGVIHRDLKPHNVFVLQDHPTTSGTQEQPRALDAASLPTVKVLDFGLSRFLENDSELTKTGIILGTPGYMAPEQANGRKTDLRTDIYGIGALLFASATGRPPFKEETPQLTVLAVMSRPPPRPRELNPSIPEDLEILIQKAMSRDADARFQDAGEMESALLALYSKAEPLDRRGHLASHAAATRMQFLFLASLCLVLGGASLVGALLALLEISGVNYASFRPTLLEWLLLGLLSLVGLLGLGVTLRHFHRQVWSNSARVASLLVPFAQTLGAATIAYGLSALLLHLAAGIEGIRAGALQLSSLPSTVLSYLVLPLNAVLAASAVLLRQRYRLAPNPITRILSGPGYSVGVVVLSLCFLGSIVKNGQSSFSASHIVPKGSPSSPASNSEEPTTPAVTGADEVGKAGETQDPRRIEVDGDEQAVDTPFETEAEAERRDKKDAEYSYASDEDLSIAREDGAEALEILSKKYPHDSAVLKALVLAHASRADTLDRSAQAIARLLDVERGYIDDVDVRFILDKALLSKGKAFKAAFIVIKQHMGRGGAELLYEIMSEHPEVRQALKPKFEELRSTNLASDGVLIAYDLKYARTCEARLQLLERAEKYGDRRSLLQLQALSTPPKRCGWGRTCYAPCNAEAKRFQRSIKKINERLSGTSP